MPRIMDLSTVATAGAQLVANSSADATGLIPTSEFALAADLTTAEGDIETISENLNYGHSTVSTDEDFTLTWGSNPRSIRHTGTLTADRAVTLSTSGATAGARFRITRTGSGAFNLNVGTGPLKALTQNMWAEFEYNGSAWFLAEHGITDMTPFAQTFLNDIDATAVLATLGVRMTKVDVYNSDATWNKPTGCVGALVLAWGAGGSGARSGSGTVSGGGGGGFNWAFFFASQLGSSESVVVGTGGAAVGSNAAGNDGESSQFGTSAPVLVKAGGGAGGIIGGGGAGGGGIEGTSDESGGAPKSVDYSATLWDVYGGGDGDVTTAGQSSVFGGGGSSSGATGGSSIWGGGAGGSRAGTTYSPGTSKFGGNGSNATISGSASAGSAPGGGGGAHQGSNSSGAGGDGRVIVISFGG